MVSSRRGCQRTRRCGHWCRHWQFARNYRHSRIDHAEGIKSISFQNMTNMLIQKSRRVSPFFVPRILINLAAGHVSMHAWTEGIYLFVNHPNEALSEGPNHACSTACATGSHSIGDAYRFIRNGGTPIYFKHETYSCVLS